VLASPQVSMSMGWEGERCVHVYLFPLPPNEQWRAALRTEPWLAHYD
jgi:hypothetical protein